MSSGERVNACAQSLKFDPSEPVQLAQTDLGETFH